MIDSEKKDSIRCFDEIKIVADVVVVGAGIAGLTAALAAARQGNKTVLITDRPILGGSASSEVRVGPGGAAASPFNRFARETGIIEEIFNHLYYKALNAGKWRWFYFDQIYFDIALSQENLSIYLNTSVYEAKKDEYNKIRSVLGLQLRSETIYEFMGKVFIDCTGDGTVGFLSGAHYRIGREGKSEFNEVYSPIKPDKKTMGASLLFTTIDSGHPVKFETPEWAIDIETLPSFERINRSINKMPDGSYYGFWWVEYGGHIDSIHDDGEIILHLRKLVNGLWGHIKNSGNYDDVENQEINWIGYLPGKRESRRLIGQYIVTSHDMMEQRKFSDSIGYTGWPIDIHPPEGYMSKEPGCTHDYIPGITDIPFRCIYSKNIDNLLFAGRHISCTHEALGTLRLISTTAVMGQAAGIASSMCIVKDIKPEDIYNKHINELQNKLIRNDQSIIGKMLFEENDYSRNAKVSVSSTNIAKLTDVLHFRYMNYSYGLILPVENRLNEISLFMEAEIKTKVTVDVYLTDGVKQNYRVKEIYKTFNIDVHKKGWYSFNLNLNECPGNKIFIIVRKNSKVKLYMSEKLLTGVLGISSEKDTLEYNTFFHTINSGKYIPLTPCFKTQPKLDIYRKEMINNGHIRPLALPNSWMSEEMKNHIPEWIKFELEEEKYISKIEIVFNSNLNPRRIIANINSVNKEMIKEYDVIVETKKAEMVIVSVNENYKRFVIHEFDKIKAKSITLRIYKTWGSLHAEVFDFRVY